jgi:hypothetical protein
MGRVRIVGYMLGNHRSVSVRGDQQAQKILARVKYSVGLDLGCLALRVGRATRGIGRRRNGVGITRERGERSG